ncbi:MAG TPA: energy transducer TonB, partial [Candidatus Binatia bacterium]|nr:energy transducer TonB [Candidatus Binatia bacterium]
AKAPEPPKPEPKPEAKAPEPPKPEPKPEAKKPEPPKLEPAKPEPAKPEPKTAEPPKPDAGKATAKAAEPKPEAKAAAKPEPAKPAATPKAGTPAGHDQAPARDAYAELAEKWKARAAGGGLGGSDTGSGPIGTGGEGKGGGELVGVDFLAYRQQVINTVKAQWTNVIVRPGLVAAVKFAIAPDGGVSGVALARSSGNPAYDASAVRAVQHVGQLPPPPARYVHEFGEFVIEFHSEEHGGEGAG